ncbi:MAG: large conductance mechanosensitive channel protein MscL [Oscillospiraceae bacterium]
MKKPGWLDEFKVFISRGNVIDLAVGVVVGGAFTAIVTALVNDIINPLISLIIGGLDFSGLNIGVFPIGDLIMSIINFLCISFVVFWMVKIINRFNRKKEKEPEPEAPAKPHHGRAAGGHSRRAQAAKWPRRGRQDTGRRRRRKNLPLRSAKITLDNPRLICYSI